MAERFDLESVIFEPLNEVNLQSSFDLLSRHVRFFSLTRDFYLRGTLKDEGFVPELSIIALNPSGNAVIGVLIAVLRKGFVVGKNCYIKVCFVDPQFQRQGLGTKMLGIIIERLKTILPWRAMIRFGDSIPRYWHPGVDLRHTSLYFFLKKHGFSSGSLRQNLTYDLEKLNREPATEKNGYKFERVRPQDFENLIEFVKKQFPIGVWSLEAKMSLEIELPTSFIAKEPTGAIVGWATHSAHYPGSFGPTGVLKSIRGKGVGGELLKWCMWDMKQNGSTECTIMWVVGETVKFYSKSIGAYISQNFKTMTKRL
jgi:GNAT superfamily N-acetyltransferase